MVNVSEQLDSIRSGILFCVPELLLAIAVVLLLLAGLIVKNHRFFLPVSALILTLSALLFLIVNQSYYQNPVELFSHTLQSDSFSFYLKLLFDIAALVTILLSWKNQKDHTSEYYALLLAVLLGAHLLVMSQNLLMIFLSIEIISISSYVLAGFAFTKQGAEGSLKYFLFGSVASAVMVYGFSILYGLTGTLDFTSAEFAGRLLANNRPLTFVAGLLSLSGLLFKVSAVPMQPWAPDVYEASPMPVVAFFSVVPKLAGIGALTKFVLAINLFGQSAFDWQTILSVIAILTLTIGNFSALLQKSPKRLMAYSSIGQSGFLLVGIITFLPHGLQFMLFYATVYMLMNLLVFAGLQYFEDREVTSVEEFSGKGHQFVMMSVILLVGFIALTGLPPTAGFTGKLFIFSSLWEAYQLSGKQILLWLLVFGLLNTVVSLFYYLKIPYYSFLKSGQSAEKQNILNLENLLGLVLVVLLLALFFWPGLLMGWINKINFVL